MTRHFDPYIPLADSSWLEAMTFTPTQRDFDAYAIEASRDFDPLAIIAGNGFDPFASTATRDFDP